MIDVEAARETLARDGLLVVERRFGPDQVTQMTRELERLFERPCGGVRLGTHPPGRMITIAPREASAVDLPAILRAFGEPDVVALARGYLPVGAEVNAKIIGTHEFRPGKINDTHFDALRSLKLMVYLMDTDERNGAFRYCPGSLHENRRLREDFLGRGGYIKDLPNVAAPTEAIELRSIVAPAGSLIVFDTEGFHAGGRLAAGAERKVLRATSFFPGQPSIGPRRFTLDWARVRFNLWPPAPPIVIPGRGSTAGTARRR
jgi:hypothetical protein